MMNIHELLEKEIFNTEPSQLARQVKYLLHAFPSNKIILHAIYDFYHRIDKDIWQKSHYENSLPELDRLLKKHWLAAWLKNGIEKDEFSILEGYLSTYSRIQCNRLQKKLAKNGPFKTDIKIALQCCANGNFEILRQWTQSRQNIEHKDFEAIIAYFNPKNIEDNFDIFLCLYQKISYFTLKDHPPHKLPLLEQEPESFKIFFDNCLAKISEFYHHFNQQHIISQALWATTSLNLDSKSFFDVAQANLFLHMGSDKALYRTFCNIEYALQKAGVYYEAISKMPGANPLDFFFDNIAHIEEHMIDIDYDIYRDFSYWKEKVDDALIVYRCHALDARLVEKPKHYKVMKL